MSTQRTQTQTNMGAGVEQKIILSKKKYIKYLYIFILEDIIYIYKKGYTWAMGS